MTLEGPGERTERRTAHDYAVAVGKRPGGETFTMSMFLPTEPGRYRLEPGCRLMRGPSTGACTVLRLPDRTRATGAGLVLLGNGLQKGLPEALTDLPADWTGPILAYLPSRPDRDGV